MHNDIVITVYDQNLDSWMKFCFLERREAVLKGNSKSIGFLSMIIWMKTASDLLEIRVLEVAEKNLYAQYLSSSSSLKVLMKFDTWENCLAINFK